MNDNVVQENGTSENFVFLVDLALDSLSTFIAFDAFNNTNNAENKAELMMESSKVRSIIDQLLSNALSFTNIALDQDKSALTTLCQKVIKECMDFELEFSLSDPSKKHDKNNQKLKAISLENALYMLENLINDCLLRLVFEVFEQLNQNPFMDLRTAKISLSDAEFELKVEEFDFIIDRIIQIGLFGISFVRDDIKVTSIIRSCLASIESLDSYLIPSLNFKDDNDQSIDILQEHFAEEIVVLQHYIHQIIDSNAFCTSLIDQLQIQVDEAKKSFDKEKLKRIVKKSEILLVHFSVNAENLKLSTDKVTKFYYNDFKLMKVECDAILNFQEPIENENSRILKRLCILTSTLKKLQNAIKLKQNKVTSLENFENAKQKFEETVDKNKIPAKCSEYFNTIKPSALTSILYETKRNSIRLSKSKKQETLTRLNYSTIPKPKVKKRQSLRMAIFRKQHDAEEKSMNDSLDLQITEILDKLTDLSTTLHDKNSQF